MASQMPVVNVEFGDRPTIEFPSETAPAGLKVVELLEGNGPMVRRGDTVTVNYHGVVWGKSTHAASDDSSTASARFLSRASTSLFEASLAYIFGALRGAFKPPGNTVCDVWHPCCTQRRITRHTLSSSLRTCTADCMAVSLAHTMSAILI